MTGDETVLLSERLPELPAISEEELKDLTKSGDLNEPLFSLYQYVATACHFTAEAILVDRSDRKQLRTVLAALVGRCARLMMGNAYLTRETFYGDVAAIIDRCIAETSVNVRWILNDDSDDRLKRYLADGLKKDLMLADMISRNVQKHDGNVIKIEDRMRRSIDGCIKKAELTPDEVRSSNGLPPYDQRSTDIGHPPEFYMGFQRMASHAVHGAWQNLLCFYLQPDEEGNLVLEDEHAEPRPDQYAAVALEVLQMLQVVAEKVPFSSAWAEDAKQALEKLVAAIHRVYQEVIIPDLEVVTSCTEPHESPETP